MHTSVLPEKTIEYLAPKTNQNFIDCTLGSGGHAFKVLENTAPRGKVLGIDQDKQALLQVREKAKERKLEARMMLVQDNFVNLKSIVAKEKFHPVHGILFDLGMSSVQLEESGKGFSFQKKEPLDMRYMPENPLSAQKIVNFWSKRDIERILKEYGEEQFAEKIAKAIVEKRAKEHITSTNQLVDIVMGATPKWYHKKKIHPATRTFQALRIAVNRELENLKEALPQCVELLEDKGILVVISFHSLEDRIVKNFLKDNAQLNLLTKKPIVATIQEIRKNPRSRSAKLRAATKIQQQ
jgi:16S rRNA (cytosine1402-N4)-methyltransferase